MDGGSADHAGAVICRPPWMAGVQITQERLSAALRAINHVPGSTCPLVLQPSGDDHGRTAEPHDHVGT